MIENIQDIKNSINILDIIQAYIPLRKNGVNYTSCCPFHNEKSASFVVSPQKNIFHCFGCGEGGNGIDFIIKHEGIDFIQAVEKAASICNLDVKKSLNKNAKEKQDKIIDMQEKLETLNVFMRKNLLKHENLIAYLLKRGFTYEVIEKYGIGLMIDKKELIDIVGMQYAKELGLITEKGYSFFANRLMLAIRNANNKIVGFSGRIHDYYNFTNSPKYINSKESILYKKSDILYNLNFAKEIMKKDKKNILYIVEGYFDALTCNLLNIPAIALCGTALNPNHLKNLARYINDNTDIYIALDSDSAGRDASIRAYKVFLEYGFVDIKVARLNPKYKDINEFYMQAINTNLQDKEKSFTIYNGLDYCLNEELSQGNIKQKQEKLRYYTQIYKKLDDYFLIEYMKPYMQKYMIERDMQVKENKSESETILIHLANDREKAFMVDRLFTSDDFNDKEAFLDIMANKQSAKFRAYALKECEDIDIDSFYRICLRYKIYTLEIKRKKALNKGQFDRDFIIGINKAIEEYKEELALPF